MVTLPELNLSWVMELKFCFKRLQWIECVLRSTRGSGFHFSIDISLETPIPD